MSRTETRIAEFTRAAQAAGWATTATVHPTWTHLVGRRGEEFLLVALTKAGRVQRASYKRFNPFVNDLPLTTWGEVIGQAVR